MTFEDKKRVLELYHDIMVDILILGRECQELRNDMLPSGIHIDDMPKSHNAHDPMATFAARLNELERRQAFLIRAAKNIRESVERLADADYRAILSLYYLSDDCSWSWVARFLKISNSSARRKARKAIDKLRFKDLKNARKILAYYAGR